MRSPFIFLNGSGSLALRSVSEFAAGGSGTSQSALGFSTSPHAALPPPPPGVSSVLVSSGADVLVSSVAGDEETSVGADVLPLGTGLVAPDGPIDVGTGFEGPDGPDVVG